jgi:putative transposase
MSRRPRPDLAGIPQHVVQRGNDRKACFFQDDDYRRYLSLLGEAARRHACALHAYVLMTNHAHFLVTPVEVGGVSRMMQPLGRNYVSTVNARYRRTGTLWEGRYKSCLVDSETYLLACHRYIELNPVRAGMIDSPSVYHWSSHAANAIGAADPLLTPHPSYLALGAEPAARQSAYRQLFNDEQETGRMAEIRA